MQNKKEGKYKSLNCAGLIIAFIFFLIGCGILALTGIEFRYIYATWSSKAFIALGPTQIAAGCVIVFTSCLGIFVFGFSKDSKMIAHFYGIILIISMLFSFAIGIFATVGAAMKGKVDKVIGCDAESTGLLTIWNNIDEFFALANSLVCSPLCKCNMTYELSDQYRFHRFAHDYLDSMELGEDYIRVQNDTKFSIDYCDKSAQYQVFRMFESNPNNTMRDVNYRKFKKYFKKIEENFECSGWCKTSYTNAFTLKKQYMFKYVFSDMNKGVPKYPGCLNRVLYFLYVFTSICASLLLLCGALQLANFIILMAVIKMRQEAMSEVKTDDFGRRLNEKPQAKVE